ncbi:dimethylarginine dimethylaminohydrolase family protein [Sessilibacter corallicola]|uniref:dimethylarginine dimethylaminohydrolase family protein n=1 Tax=Sessilibacter corallicola TaxID=2904075 RepID=UPI001E422477|nr:arginine deiminase family protein [Sessilibacter corallicola]MCE2027036.1 arginine deiminase family protein [Sessilibacter corallicola]
MAEFSFKNRQDGGNTQPLEHWGMDSEYGVLTDILLGPVDNFGWLPSNATARRTLRKGDVFDAAVAAEQHQTMREIYQSAGVNVHMLTPDANHPYQIFARDSSVMTPWGPIITQMSNHWRRGEWTELVRFYHRMNIPVYDMVSTGTFEGGDFHILKPGVVACGYSGDRTTKEAIDQVSAWFEVEGWEFYAYEFDPFYLHLDVLFSMLTEGLAVACIDALEPEFIQWLKEKNIELIDVSFKNAMHHMGCNVVALGNDRVLLPAEASSLIDACKANGLEVMTVDVSMISRGGGSLHCMCQPLKRESVVKKSVIK